MNSLQKNPGREIISAVPGGSQALHTYDTVNRVAKSDSPLDESFQVAGETGADIATGYAIEKTAQGVIGLAGRAAKEASKKIANPGSALNSLSSETTAAASSANAKAAIESKLKGIEGAQKKAVETRKLSDGRIRYYKKELPAHKEGPTRGSTLVTEYNPKTGSSRQWIESYDHSGKVNRVHPKTINGQNVRSQHYPPTGKELGK